jgi:hypothetical protein
MREIGDGSIILLEPSPIVLKRKAKAEVNNLIVDYKRPSANYANYSLTIRYIKAY